MTSNKKILQALGILLGIILLAAILISAFRGGLSIFDKPLPIEAQPTTPRIVRQKPMEGQRLNLSEPITLTFDRDMDSAQTEKSFALLSAGEKISGRGIWSDPRTFVFTPKNPLQPATIYIATFTTAARALDGTSPADEISLEFKTVESLAVAQTFPADKTAEVDLGASITVIFNRPVVPLSIKEDQAKLPQPLKFSPEIEGKGEWVNSSVYVFTPAEYLHSGTNYQATVNAGLTDTLGNSLAESFSWKFATRRPIIINIGLKNGEQNPAIDTEVKNVPLNQIFIVTFGQPMNRESVEFHTSISDRETNQFVPVKFSWDEKLITLTIEPKQDFKIAGFYKLVIDGKAQAADGGQLLEDGMVFPVSFATVPLPSIVSVYPPADSTGDEYNSGIVINFASPMDFDSLKGKVVVSPALKGENNFNYNEYANTLYLDGLEAGTDYVVRILPGMKDVYGNAIKNEISYSFKNGDYYPYAHLFMPWTPLVYRANGIQDVYFQHRNIEEGSIAVYPITRSEFMNLSTGNASLSAFAPQGKPAREWQIKAGRKNTLEYNRFLLDEKRKLEPGYYFIGIKAKPFDYSDNFLEGYVFIVANDNVTLKATSTEGLAWVTDLESGAPRANVPVTFYDVKFHEVGKATTDKSGLAYLDDIQAVSYAEAGGGEFGFTALYWGSDITAYDFGYYQNYSGSEARLFSYLYTDRPIYRPDQDVFFKGILRENDDMHYSLSKLKRVYVVAEQWGEKIFEGYVPVSEQGSFSGKIKLARDISLGSYNLYVYMSNAQSEASIGYVQFNVAEYKKPEYEVKIAAQKTDVRAGEKTNFNLDAAYYSGGVLKNAQVNWFAESSNYYFSPSKPYQEYSFMDWDRDVSWYASYQPSMQVLDEGKDFTDENGHLNITQAFNLGKDKMSKNVTLSANVTDVAGNVVSGGATVVVHASDYYAGIRSEKYIGVVGEPQTFNVVILGWDSQPVAGQKATVSFIQREWLSVQKKNETGVLSWETSIKETLVGEQEIISGEDGTAQVNFSAPKGGVYKALVTVTDSKGGTHQASTYIWFTSNEVTWRQSNDRQFSLIADKETYQPGDTAEILIAQPFDHDVYALVTYERGHIYKQEVVLLKGSGTIYKMPITDEMAPAIYITVTVISGADKGGKPDFKIGMTRLNVSTEQKTINVKITADKQVAGPGDDVTYTIETTDIHGKPVSADVSLAVVDKAVLALAPPNSAPMLTGFYSNKLLSVMTALGIVSSADDFNEEYRQSPPDGRGSGGGGGGEAGVITVRENFKDTAAFKADVTTDENGLAQVKVTLPENLTTWQADVRAVTEDTRVGQVTSELVSTKPLYVQLQTPRFFVVNDQAVIGATVFNNSDKALKVNVLLDSQGAEIKSDALQTVDVPAKQQAYVTWDVVVDEKSTRVDFTATATSGEFTDASKPPLGTLPQQGIPVLNFTIRETVGTSGVINSANSVTENIQLPESVDFSDAKLSVEISPSLAASMTSGLDYLEDYPYLCMEQTVSRFLPNVIAARALENAGIESPLKNQLDANVNAALQRIYARQLYDGGWNWWDGSESDLQTSAYVLYGLIEAKEARYNVSEKVMESGIAYLRTNLPNLKRNGSSWEYNRHAFMLYVLARADALGASSVNFLFDNRASLDNYGKAYLAQAMHLLDPEDSRIETLMSDLTSAAALSSSGAHWQEKQRDYYNWNSDTRSTAIILNAFVQIEPKNPLTANAVRWLMSHRDSGHWYSTQETTWSLIALTHWMIAADEFKTDYKYAVGLNGEMLQDGRADKNNLSETIKLDLQLKEEVNNLVFARGSGTGSLYYSAYLSAALPVDQIQPLDQGISIAREYFALDDPKTPITEIERGELVKVRLTMVVPEGAHYIVIDDPLPAGLEAVNQSLLTDTAVPSIYTAQDYKERGWGWWYFTHIELRDEKITLSADYLPAGSYTYTYIARASTTGIFNVIPPTASEFYFPDVAGRGAGSVFTVK